MARAATTADAFNAVAEPRRRQILDVLAGGERPVNDLVRRARAGSATGVQAPAGAPRSGSGRRARRRTAAAVPAQRPRAQAHPRLGEELRALVVGAVRRGWTSCWKTSSRRRKEMAVTSSGTATVTLPTDEQILITREFDAPKHLVYKAWTTPELVKRWWNANRGEVTIAEIDLRVGGRWRYVMVRRRRIRGRLPRRVPRDRPERADRLDRGLRGHARRPKSTQRWTP